MPPGPILMESGGGDGQYTSKDNITLSERAVRRLSAKYDYPRRRLSSSGGTDSNSSSSSSGSVDTSELSEHEKLQIESCFRGLKTQVFVCSSLANLYMGSSTAEQEWQLHFTGVPVVLLDTGETKSRNKRKIQIILAERGTCFTLWQDTIDNLTSYKVSGRGFHTMCLSSDHTKLIGLSFDCVSAAQEMWQHIERLTACPENINLSLPGSRNKKQKKPVYQPLPEKSHISQPCFFQHITNVDLNDRTRYFSLQTLLPVLPDISSSPENNSEEL
ncbi:misexpression suppressor of ras 3 [Lycorma delicatula]|uniref:misexpression suppressor of ras 3 n=1 Tax=Lycorma delicatula TaxID=130591 RepID=UPI003F518D49